MSIKSDTENSQKTGRWLPLESNPDILNDFSYKMGLPKSWGWCDIYGLDPDLLSFVPRPVACVVLLFPSSENHKKFKEAEKKKIEEDSQEVSKRLFFLNQHDTIGNACGTIATVHALSNCGLSQPFQLADGALSEFISKCANKTPEQIGWDLVDCQGIQDASELSAENEEAQTETPDREDRLNHHFVAFVQMDGNLYELDGRKAFPINHGATSDPEFLGDTASVIQKNFLALDPDNLRFSMCALVKKD
eukprot:1322_1